MRLYEVCANGEEFLIKADDISLEKDNLKFFVKKRPVAIFRTWDVLIDITEKSVEKCS